jgi:hypothetical protein
LQVDHHDQPSVLLDEQGCILAGNDFAEDRDIFLSELRYGLINFQAFSG